MEDKRISEQESLQIISRMISETKQCATPANFNIMKMWGWLNVLVTLLVFIMLKITHDNVWNWLWFLIPVIGGSAMWVIFRREEKESLAVSYVSKAVGTLWCTLGITFGLLMLIAIVFAFRGYNVWSMIFILTPTIVGVGCIATGAMLRMKSFVFGGLVSVLCGSAISCLFIVQGSLTIDSLFFFVVAFFAAMLFPSYFISDKKNVQ